MSYIYKGVTGWIKQPNQKTQVFRSGLCLISQEYISRKDSVDYYAFNVGDIIPSQDSPQCIDGAYIYPEPNYEDMGNGFIKCSVTAYGRVNIDGSRELFKKVASYEQETRVESYPAGSVTPTIVKGQETTQKLFDVITLRFVTFASDDVPIKSPIQLYIYDLNGDRLPSNDGSSIFSQVAENNLIETIYYLSEVCDSYESRNYGNFNEIIITISATGSNLVIDKTYN